MKTARFGISFDSRKELASCLGLKSTGQVKGGDPLSELNILLCLRPDIINAELIDSVARELLERRGLLRKRSSTDRGL